MLDNHHGLRGVDTAMPNVARIYDVLLGGKDNYPADREAAEQLLRAAPDAAAAATENRAFLRRAVQFLAEDAGIRQFIDIGTGLPTQGNVHEVAQQFISDARVLYVDYDSVVIAHAQALLCDNATTVAINRDLREPDQILSHPALQALIDPDQPVAILLVAILHFITDDENPLGIVERLKEYMAPGSYLVISHVTADDVPPEVTERARRLYENSTAPVITRTQAEVTRFFDGLEVIPPGIVSGSSWRPDWRTTSPGRTIFYAGAGRK